MFPRYAGLLLLSLSLGQAEEPVAIVEQPITDADREHWAWRPLGQAVIPRGALARRPASPIDHFAR